MRSLPAAAAPTGPIRPWPLRQQRSPTDRPWHLLFAGWEPTMVNLGHTMRKLRQWDAAIDCYRQALGLKPGQASSGRGGEGWVGWGVAPGGPVHRPMRSGLLLVPGAGGSCCSADEAEGAWRAQNPASQNHSFCCSGVCLPRTTQLCGRATPPARCHQSHHRPHRRPAPRLPTRLPCPPLAARHVRRPGVHVPPAGRLQRRHRELPQGSVGARRGGQEEEAGRVCVHAAPARRGVPVS